MMKHRVYFKDQRYLTIDGEENNRQKHYYGEITLSIDDEHDQNWQFQIHASPAGFDIINQNGTDEPVLARFEFRNGSLFKVI